MDSGLRRNDGDGRLHGAAIGFPGGGTLRLRAMGPMSPAGWKACRPGGLGIGFWVAEVLA